MDKPTKTAMSKASGKTPCYNFFISWLRRKTGINKLEEDNRYLRNMLNMQNDFVMRRLAELKEYTRVDADIGLRGNNTIVLTGVYRRKAYVQFWDIGDGEFEKLVDHLRSMKDHALIRNIDSPPTFKGVFEL